MFLVQAQGAVMRALVPTATVLSARSDRQGLNRVLLNSTRYGTLLLCWIGIPAVILARPFMTLWLGNDFASHSFPILQVLLIANMLRLTFLPYATIITGVNQHNKIAIVGLAEGLVNITFSVFLGQRFGAIGVAFGTLIGAAASILMHLVYSMSVTDSVSVKRSDLLSRGFLIPFLSFVPWLFLWRICDSRTAQISFLLHLLGCGIALLLSWTVSIASVERQKIIVSISGLFSRLAVGKAA
jgi:O-antigen/teichoic acid export membrane protein